MILDSMKATSRISFPMRVKVLIFINRDFPCNYKIIILGKKSSKVIYIT